MFPVSSIPATGTIKTKRARRGKSSISDFSAQGESPLGLGTVSFSAALDGGQGAKGTVTIKLPKKEPVVISFNGKG